MKKESESMRDMFKLSFGEEIGNSVSHGVMAVLCLLVLPYVAVRSYLNYGVIGTVGQSIYVICIFTMFLGSCIYHAMEFGSNQKYVFRILDHCFIYLAIAGTYTPILLSLVGGTKGLVLLIIEWGTTIAGILMTACSRKAHKVLSMVLYMAMGWIAIFILPTLIKVASPLFLGLIVLGGVFYTIGAVFYAKKFPYAHFVWHIFINLASIAHFIAIVFIM